MQEFAIYGLPVGRGVMALSPMPRRDADVSAIVAWAPDLVVSMCETHELRGALAADLGDIAWCQVPVADFDVPDDRALWADAQARIGRVLSAEGRVLVHCMGGCGRSGMAVLRMMVATGENPEAALVRLRHVRPCAVETDAQQAWAAAQPDGFRPSA